MPQISATIITHNEGRNIARAIRSLGCTDEIIVVDSNSTDETREIAADLGVRVIVRPWEGFASQKNFSTTQAHHDWILSLDADEELDATAQAAIREWKERVPAAAGYQFARRARYLGRWIRHSGWYPDTKLRLFDRRLGRWEGPYVHESVVVEGRVESLRGEILHYTCDSIQEHRQRIEFYTYLAAQELFEKRKRVGFLQRLLAPGWVFLNTYFFRLAILDGYPGFLIARMAALYVARKYSKLARLNAGPSRS